MLIQSAPKHQKSYHTAIFNTTSDAVQTMAFVLHVMQDERATKYKNGHVTHLGMGYDDADFGKYNHRYCISEDIMHL